MRPIKTLWCHTCGALWLFWPKEVTGMDTDSLNLRSEKSCSSCEPASSDELHEYPAGYPVKETKDE
jgi:hypothetical protein